MDDAARARARAQARSAWPVAKTSLKAHSNDFVEGTPSERVAMVWSITLDAWASSGRELPRYDRRRAPGRMLRGRSERVLDAEALERLEVQWANWRRTRASPRARGVPDARLTPLEQSLHM